MTTVVKIAQFQPSAVMQMKKQTPTRDMCDITYFWEILVKSYSDL